MTSRIARSGLMVVGMLVVGLAQAAPVQAQARTTRTVFVEPWEVRLDPEPRIFPNGNVNFYACLPEAIVLAGQIRSQITKTIDGRGRVHYTHQLIPNQVVGYGEVSKARYRANGMHYHSGEILHDETVPEPAPPFHLAYMQNFYVIGQGPAVDLLLKILLRVTVDANGNPHGFVEQVRVECR